MSSTPPSPRVLVVENEPAAGIGNFRGGQVEPGAHWHCDTITRLPAGSAVLAHTGAYPCQAFRVGSRAWGVLFHPEATLGSLAAWAGLTGLDTDDARAVVRRARERQGEIIAASRAIAADFARVVRSSAAQLTAARRAR